MIGLGKKYGADALNKLKQTIYTSSTLEVINEIQDKYHVSAAFMLAVSDYATKLGTVDNNIVKVGYNLFKYPGTSKDIVVTVDGKIFKAYSSYGASFTDFARLMAEGASYFKAGNINISQISKIYTPSSSDTWANDIATRVSEIMNYKTYSALPSKGIHNYSTSGKVKHKYSDNSINVSIEEISNYYVTKIWVYDPASQVKKAEAGWNKSLKTVKTMLDNINYAIVGCNGSGFYLSRILLSKRICYKKIRNIEMEYDNRRIFSYI